MQAEEIQEFIHYVRHLQIKVKVFKEKVHLNMDMVQNL
jgi:hypothetical protein